jgi:four helix bundle protein
MSDFRKLKVWRKAHALAIAVHGTASGIRGQNNAALRSQMVRAAMSIPANIVEGCGQESRREFARFLRYAANSASELHYHLINARDTKVLGANDFASLVAKTIEVKKMLNGLLKRVSASFANVGVRDAKAVDQPDT